MNEELKDPLLLAVVTLILVAIIALIKDYYRFGSLL